MVAYNIPLVPPLAGCVHRPRTGDSHREGDHMMFARTVEVSFAAD